MKKEYHFADKLVTLIDKSKNQELATHTFSHYYCLEEGQTKESFYADLEAAKKIAKEKNISLKSLVFPRNQYAILEKILIHFKKLESNYEYKSCTMKEISTLLEY